MSRSDFLGDNAYNMLTRKDGRVKLFLFEKLHI